MYFFLSWIVDCAALPGWQGNIGFAPYLEVISVLGLQGGEKGSLVVPFHFLFLTIPQSLFVQSLLDTFSPGSLWFCCNHSSGLWSHFSPLSQVRLSVEAAGLCFLGLQLLLFANVGEQQG